jgi:Tfp pilus assembly protein PilN
LQAQTSAFGTVKSDQVQVEGIKAQVIQVLEADVSWGRLLQGVARTIPSDVWISSFQGAASKGSSSAPSAAAQTAAGLSGSAASNNTPSASPAAGSSATTAAVAGGGPSGTITFSASGLDFTSVASWLQRMAGVPALSNVWVASASRPAQTPGGPPAFVTFSSTATFNSSARSDRIKQLQKDTAG